MSNSTINKWLPLNPLSMKPGEGEVAKDWQSLNCEITVEDWYSPEKMDSILSGIQVVV